MKVVRTIAELRRAGDGRVGLVPTMGAFHEGTCSLMRAARAECDRSSSRCSSTRAVRRDEDLDALPARRGARRALGGGAGVDVLFVRRRGDVPDGFATWVDVDVAAARPRAPGHFRGVATVCVKLFNLVRPDVAYFGQKDAQQVAVLRQVVRDLNVGVELRVLPDRARRGRPRALVAERLPDGDERSQALALPRALGGRRTAADPVAARMPR
jgi:pantoate--beta-alanine ligase